MQESVKADQTTASGVCTVQTALSVGVALPDDAQRLNVLASFAHEVLMGAIRPKDLAAIARLALERTGLLRLDDVVALGVPEVEAPLPHWEPCNPGCDPEFNGQRSRYCAKLCQNAREALAAAGVTGGAA